MLSVLPLPVPFRGLDFKRQRAKERFSFCIAWHHKGSSREPAFTKPWQKSQIDSSGGDTVEFRSPSPGRDRRFPEGSVLCNTM